MTAAGAAVGLVSGFSAGLREGQAHDPAVRPTAPFCRRRTGCRGTRDGRGPTLTSGAARAGCFGDDRFKVALDGQVICACIVGACGTDGPEAIGAGSGAPHYGPSDRFASSGSDATYAVNLAPGDVVASTHTLDFVAPSAEGGRPVGTNASRSTR